MKISSNSIKQLQQFPVTLGLANLLHQHGIPWAMQFQLVDSPDVYLFRYEYDGDVIEFHSPSSTLIQSDPPHVWDIIKGRLAESNVFLDAHTVSNVNTLFAMLSLTRKIPPRCEIFYCAFGTLNDFILVYEDYTPKMKISAQHLEKKFPVKRDVWNAIKEGFLAK